MADREKKDPKLSIIILNYHTDNLLLDLIKNLGHDDEIEIVLVDNSNENTLEMKLPERKDISYFSIGENLGFSGGNNYGISKAKGEWLLLLNSDTKTTTTDVQRLMSVTIKENFLVSCPKLIQPDGAIQNNVGFFDKFFKSPINYIFARPRFIDCSNVQENTTTDLLTGAAMLIHKSVFKKIGLLDDNSFFMYFEDIDFSYRLNQSGIKVLYIPEVTVTHFGGASSDQNVRQKNKNYQQGLQTYVTLHRGAIINLINNFFHFFS